MASVRITQEIISHVDRTIDKLFADRKAKKLMELQHLDVGQQVYRKHVSAEAEAMATKLNDIHGKWIDGLASITVEIEYTVPNGTGGQVARKHTFQVTYKPPVLAPLSFGRGYGVKYDITPDLPCHQHVTRVMLEHEQICDECRKLHHGLGGLFRQAGTLKQVLEVWPTALDYIPDEARQKHMLKVDPVKREKKELAVSDEAKMLLMKARMLNNV